MVPCSASSQSPGPAVEHLMDILDLLEDAATGISVESVADSTGLPVEHVELCLEALEGRGCVERASASHTYRLAWARRGR